jgi:D-alanine-D-alanine ligase-like ATP-grasp enzyme
LEYIPKEKEKVYLRYTSNLALGGVSIDATEKAHVSVIEIAKQALSTFSGMPCVGIDFITQDITADQSGIIHAIIEVNSNPGLTMHMQPAVGKPQNVASYLADVMFPDL